MDPCGVQAGQDSGPTSTTVPSTRVPAPPPPEGEPRGFLRIATHPAKGASRPPPPRQAPASESPAIEALTRGDTASCKNFRFKPYSVHRDLQVK